MLAIAFALLLTAVLLRVVSEDLPARSHRRAVNSGRKVLWTRRNDPETFGGSLGRREPPRPTGRIRRGRRRLVVRLAAVEEMDSPLGRTLGARVAA